MKFIGTRSNSKCLYLIFLEASDSLDSTSCSSSSSSPFHYIVCTACSRNHLVIVTYFPVFWACNSGKTSLAVFFLNARLNASIDSVLIKFIFQIENSQFLHCFCYLFCLVSMLLFTSLRNLILRCNFSFIFH